MSIASAIAATSPNLWYKLDGSDGTSAPNSGSLANNGTVSGPVDWTVIGPEVGTTGLRLFSGGQVVSAAMDISTFRNLSMGLWLSYDASGTISVSTPILGIGDVGNRMARGPIIWESHAVVGSPGFGSRWNVAGGSVTATPEPKKFWHFFCMVCDTSTNTVRSYMDGLLGITNNITGVVSAALTDPMLLRSDQPIVVTHMAYWAKVLTVTEIQSISSQVAPWPYTLPINTPLSVIAEGGGLTEVQAEQLTAIDTKTDDIPGLVVANTDISAKVNATLGYVSDMWTNLLPSLQTKVQEIADGILVTLQTTPVPVVRSIGEVLRILSPEFWADDDLSDGVTCERIDVDLSNGAYFGVTVVVTEYPEGWKFQTPDQAWGFHDLAVLSFVRGGTVIERHGVHAVTHSVSPLPGSPYGFALGVASVIQSPDYHVTVDWAPGVCGRLIGSVLP